MNTEQTLINAGLTEVEAKIYLELLRHPYRKKFDLVKRTGFSKSTVYRAINALEDLKIIKNGKALSLKPLANKHNKIASKLHKIQSFLAMPEGEVEELKTFTDKEEIVVQCLKMAEHPYDTCLDFGDFENYTKIIGESYVPRKFRRIRSKHANHKAILTNFGDKSAEFCTKKQCDAANSQVESLNLDIKNQFVFLSDTYDAVFFNSFEDPENPFAVLVKSKGIADFQRAQFQMLSKMAKF